MEETEGAEKTMELPQVTDKLYHIFRDSVQGTWYSPNTLDTIVHGQPFHNITWLSSIYHPRTRWTAQWVTPLEHSPLLRIMRMQLVDRNKTKTTVIPEISKKKTQQQYFNKVIEFTHLFWQINIFLIIRKRNQ